MARIRTKARRGKGHNLPGGKAKINTKGFRFQMDKGWDKYGNATDVRRFKRVLNRHKKKAFDAIARDMINDIIRGSNNFAPNAPLTLLLKRGNKPLVGGGKSGIQKSITTKSISQNELFIGFSKNSKFYPKAKLIHDGGSIKVTHKMRMLFWALFLVSKGEKAPSSLSKRGKELWKLNQEWFPLNNNTNVIKIPGRPFIEEVFKDKRVVEKARKRFIKAINRTLRDLARNYSA